VTRRRARRGTQLLDLKQKIGYWKFEGEALDRTLWGTGFGRGYGIVVTKTAGVNGDWSEFARILTTLLHNLYSYSEGSLQIPVRHLQ
jgi:hypothetical protein